MTITIEAYTGTETVGTTEWSITTDTAGPNVDANVGIYQAFIDLSALQAYDVYQFKCYEKARTGDTQRVVFSAYFEGVQADPIAVTPTLILGVGWDMTLKKLSGTDRAIAWRISKIT